MKRKRLLIFSAAIVGSTFVVGAGVYAQTLAGTTAAVGAGAELDAAGGGFQAPSKYAAKATNAMNGAGQEAEDEAGGAPAGSRAAGGTTTTTTTTTTVSTSGGKKPLNWGTGGGDQMVREMTAPRPASRQTTRRSSRSARRVATMTKAQRTRMVKAKYIKPPVGYLSWYLKDDRYKVSSKVWQFVTTPNDRYYYRPWASAMRLRSPGRVIGFHTWQDAMIAGYRPDPVSRPEPGPQLAYLAGLTRGPMLSTYFEYVYAGQITPATFDANYRYVRYVANTVGSHRHTRHLVGDTINQVLGAAIGQGSVPTSVGGGGGAMMASGGYESSANIEPMPINMQNTSTTGDMPSGGADSREEDYNKFGARAGALSRNPGQ